MGYIQKDAFRTMLLSYVGMVLGYVNKGLLFIFLLSLIGKSYVLTTLAVIQSLTYSYAAYMVGS
jgi:uncharacterized protein YacL